MTRPSTAAGRGAIVACALLLAGLAPAQDDLSSLVLDLEYPSLDLEYPVESVEGTADAVEGAVEALEIEETETEIRIELSGDVLFDFDKWDLKPEAEPTLEKVAEVIRKYRDARITIEGYTDSKGSDSYNQNLSQERADSVKNWLMRKKAIGSVLTARGRGEADPVAPNENPDGSDNPEGRQKNRRVEITVKKG